MACAAPLASPPPIAEERKVVTILFCDLVGSTALGEDADPEDVAALLRRYGALARRVVESYGGVVEKFIGDAVVAVFGVPAVHEDDPERAVRAGLKLVAAVEDLPAVAGRPVQVRVGINTGEAVVRLDVSPGSGEGFLAGDAVNTGARLQSSAPPMGVVVGALTHELTRKVIAYEALTPATVRGKREPIEVWRATGSVTRTGARAPDDASPFVGRTVELGYLRALLDKAADASSPQIALIVGDPGIGKSRLVQELFSRVDEGSRVVTWRQGRCLPYGEGVTFRALVEILRGHAGILEDDGREAVEGKLEHVLPEGEDREWFRQRLRALLGLEAPPAEREENFTAWLRFLEDVASRRPTVLVLEDLHWADDALLDFLEFFALHVTRVPLLVVATARPDLFDQHPSFAATARINRIALERLTDDETEELAASLVDEVAGELRASIVQRAQGNPFFTEESARLVRDHAEEGTRATLLAGSVQAVIAARIDALDPELKTVLGDAAVAGDVFWDGQLAHVGSRSPADLARALDRLTAKQLVYRVRTSSMADGREYAFAHALTREVAYAELPRRVRARKHQAVAAWMESQTGGREEERVEVLAYHHLTALELARDARDGPLAGQLLAPTIDYLTRAAGRVMSVDVPAAERYCSRAVDLAPERGRSPELLCTWARVLALTERHRESVAAWQEAVAGLRARGESARAAVAMCEMAFEYETVGLPVWDMAEESLALAREAGPSPELAIVLPDCLNYALMIRRKTPQEVLDGVAEALAMSRDLGLPPSPAALAARASARFELGDERCLEDLEQEIEEAKTQGLAVVEELARLNSTMLTMDFHGAPAAKAAVLRFLETARRRGNRSFARGYETQLVVRQYFTGDWDESLETARALDTVLLGTEDFFNLFVLQCVRVWILTAKGLPDLAEPLVRWLAEHVLSARPGWSADVCVASVAWRSSRGEQDAVRHLLAELEQYPVLDLLWQCLNLTRWALAAHDRGCAARLVGDVVPSTPLRRHVLITGRALLDESGGSDEAAAGFADAAARWRDFGVPYEEAHALLGRGRCLVKLGRSGEAAQPLERAREIFARLGARPALAETGQWQGRAASH